MKAWDQFLKDVLPKVAGCPEVVAEHAVRRAAQEFLGTTRVWKLWLDPITTIDGQTEYDIPLEVKSELVRLERATLDGQEIDVRTTEQLPADWKTYPDTLARGIHTEDRRVVILLPAQGDDLVLRIEASIRPSEAATGVQDHIHALYALQIADGAVAMLKEHVGTSYGDAAGSEFYRKKFDGHMGVADYQRFRGASSARPRPRLRTF